MDQVQGPSSRRGRCDFSGIKPLLPAACRSASKRLYCQPTGYPASHARARIGLHPPTHARNHALTPAPPSSILHRPTQKHRHIHHCHSLIHSLTVGGRAACTVYIPQSTVHGPPGACPPAAPMAAHLAAHPSHPLFHQPGPCTHAAPILPSHPPPAPTCASIHH